MDTETLLELVPHYLAMLLLVFLVLRILDAAVGGVSLWLEFLIIALVVLLYRPLVKRLGVAPSRWEKL